MSGRALIWAANVKGLKPATKIVLIQLSERHNKDTGRCDPRISLLADDCEMDRSTVLRHLKILEEIGLVTREARGNENGGRASTQYHLHMGVESQIATGGRVANQGGVESQFEGGRVATVRPPYIEPVLNQEEPTPKPPEGDDLFSAKCSGEESDQSDDIERGFIEFWDEIWPRHKRKTGRADCRKVYRAACTGKHPKADKVAPADLNDATRLYIASVRDMEFLKGPLPWLRLPGWEPFIGRPDRREETYEQRILREYGR